MTNESEKSPREMSDEELLARASQLANRVTTHMSDNGAGSSTGNV